MSMIKDFLLQLTMIAIPIFTYHTFFAETIKKNRNEKIVTSALWALSVIFCMSFAATIGTGQRFDLRLIPLLLGTLYCGFETGVSLLVIVLLYRFYFGMDIGFYHSVLSMLFTFPLIVYFQKSFERSNKEERVKIAVLLACYYSFVVITWFIILGIASLQNFCALMIFLVFAVIATWLFTTLNEKIGEIHHLGLEVQKAEKLRLLSDLTSSFAHEIRNPMQVNRGFLQLMEKESFPDHIKRYIDLCIKEMDRANEIINDYLSFAKPQSENVKSIEISKELHQVKNIVAPYALSQGVEIILDISDELFVLADPQKFKQCFINLIKNGIEAMTNGGVITISSTLKDNEQVLIDIIDQGIGMTQEQINKLGTPFYTLKDKGTGLGLMVSFRLIQSFNGSIQINSELGKGSIFSIALPKSTGYNR